MESVGPPTKLEATKPIDHLALSQDSYPSPAVASLDNFQQSDLSDLPTPPLQLPPSQPSTDDQPTTDLAPVQSNPEPNGHLPHLSEAVGGTPLAATNRLNGYGLGGLDSTPAPAQPLDVPPAPVAPLPTPSQIPSPVHVAESVSSMQVQPPTPGPGGLAIGGLGQAQAPAPSPLGVQPQLATAGDYLTAGSSPVDLNGLKRPAGDVELGLDESVNKRAKVDENGAVPVANGGHSTQSPPGPPAQVQDTFNALPPAPAPAPPAASPAPPVQPSYVDPAAAPALPIAPVAPVQTFLPPATSYPAHAYAPAPPPHPASSEPGPVQALTKEQHKFANNIVKQLKKHKQAGPFLRPVDPVALLIPDYFRLITRPSDLGSVEAKLVASGKAIQAAVKQGKTYAVDYSGVGEWEGKAVNVYRTAQEFLEDLERIWTNCFTYNGPRDKNPVSAMAGAMKDQADKLLRTMPAAPLVEYQPTPVSAHPTPAPAPAPAPAYAQSPAAYSPPPARSHQPSPAPAPVPAPQPRDRRPSNTFVPTIRRSEDGNRPKREIHAPARELAYHDEPAPAPNAVGKGRTGRVSGKAAQEELRFCKEVIRELFKKTHEAYAFPFYAPVDWRALNIPQYPQIIRQPMDLGTVRSKLDNGQYPSPMYQAFEQDVRLVFNNCYTFNPPGTPVHDMGRRLEGVFEHKWDQRPIAEEEESEDDGISEMEKQLRTMQDNLERMKEAKQREKDQQRRQQEQQYVQRPPPPKQQVRQSSSYDNTYQAKPPKPAPKPKAPRQSGGGQGGRKQQAAQPTEVTFEMKRELAVKIVSFEGADLEKAIDIIRNGRPDLLSDANKEIELDIDQLDQRTLLALYRFVCPQPVEYVKKAPKPAKAPPGNKRKNLDELAESQRIEALEARLKSFENGGGAEGGMGGGQGESSDSSGSDDSDSDSDDD